MDEWIKGIKDAVHEDRLHMRRKKTQSMVVKRSGDEYPSESVGKGYASKLDSGIQYDNCNTPSILELVRAHTHTHNSYMTLIMVH